jgi:hypothetical protein
VEGGQRNPAKVIAHRLELDALIFRRSLRPESERGGAYHHEAPRGNILRKFAAMRLWSAGLGVQEWSHQLHVHVSLPASASFNSVSSLRAWIGRRPH